MNEQVDNFKQSEVPHRPAGSGAGMDKLGTEISLSSSQLEAVSHGKGPMLIVAGAGSGKTRTLTERLTHLINSGVPAVRIIAITFTNKAAEEMRSRIKSRVPFIGTFHSFGAKILRKEAGPLGRTKNFVIFDADDSLKIIKKLLVSREVPTRYSPPKARYEISKIKNNLIDPSELDNWLMVAFNEYENELRRQNAFDFDDLIEKVVQLFRLHPEVRKIYQNKFNYILVDEYQDINLVQYVLVKLLGEGHRNLNVVGDDEQAIYGFRWSDFTNFLNFEKDWPEAKIVELGENYRSTATIVKAAAAVIGNNKFQRPKDLWTRNDPGKPVKVIGAENAEEEAEAIARDILKEQSKEFAILYRTNAQSRALEQALSFNSIPYEVFGGLKFYERKEIKDLVAGLRYALNPRDELSRERLEKTFRRAPARELVQNLPELAAKLSLIELIGFFLKTTSYFEFLRAKFENANDRIENVSELIQFASTFKSLPDFLERISLLQPMDGLKANSPQRRVRLMTIHLAKGLEFDSVYVAGVGEGLIPHQRSLASEAELEEERRLMYVAMTRAKYNLTLGFYGLASRFLYEIPPELIDFKIADDSTSQFAHDEFGEKIISLD